MSFTLERLADLLQVINAVDDKVKVVIECHAEVITQSYSGDK
jgi:hypothetical protein